jgi:hypothetical protein
MTQDNVFSIISRYDNIIDFATVDVRKSGEMWRLFSENGFDLESLLKNIILARSINWKDIVGQINDKTYNVLSAELFAFADSINQYISHL